MLRLFAAVFPPDDIAASLVRLQRGLDGALWRPRENFHVTLRFFGEIDERRADDLDGELRQIAVGRFDLAFAGPGHFGGAAPNHLWLGTEHSPALSSLAQKCERAARRAGIAPEPQKYQPHLTLAYLRAGTWLPDVMAFEQRLALYKSERFAVESFGLYSSRTGKGASQYRLEREYPLL